MKTKNKVKKSLVDRLPQTLLLTVCDAPKAQAVRLASTCPFGTVFRANKLNDLLAAKDLTIYNAQKRTGFRVQNATKALKKWPGKGFLIWKMISAM